MRRLAAVSLTAMTLSMLIALTPASAHVRTAPTQLSINVSDERPDRGDEVRFFGRLQSPWDRCEEDQKVHLKRGRTIVDTTMTNDSGRYSFERRIFNDSNWRVRFTGKRFGVHPHVHRCLPDTSRVIRIRFPGD